MRLLRYLVRNFRSVMDSGWIEADAVTALIGVNESGKTNLLTPLWKLNPAREGEIQPTADYPKAMYGEIREKPGAFDFISAEFAMSPYLQFKVAELAGRSTGSGALDVVRVTRFFDGKFRIEFPNYQPPRTVPHGELRTMLDAAATEIAGTNELKQEEGLRQGSSERVRSVAADLTSDEEITAERLAVVVAQLKQLIPATPAKTSTIVARLQQLIDNLTGRYAVLTATPPGDLEAVSEAVLAALPKFVYYSNYGNLDSEIYLPHVVENLKRTDPMGAREEAKARTLRVLFKFVKLKPTEILELGQEPRHPDGRRPTQPEIDAAAEKKRERSILLQSAGTMLTKRFAEWWKQGDYKFRFEADGNHFRIWVSDARRPAEVELESRSTGLQWFLSFYLVFLVESEGEHEEAILLLDEPGLSLHPLAQRDLSEFFDGLSTTNQLIYTTHSPFLVDADRLDRVRKVYVDDAGDSKATPDLRYGETDRKHAGAAYAVHSALNLSVAESLLLGCQPVILEGASDQHYLTLIKALLIGAGKLSPPRELVFPPSGGAKTVKVVASMLLGRDDLLPKVLLDSDEQGRRMLKELRSDLYHEHQDRLLNVSSYTGFDGAEVEDLMPPDFFALVVDRWDKRAETPFADVVKAGQPLVPQVEVWAKAQGVPLAHGWKVEIAKRAKQLGLLRGIFQFDQKTIEVWLKLFNDLLVERA